MSVIWFILILGFLVLVHEFGHFISSIILGVKVEEFAIGFGPPIIKKKIKNIVWRINIIPLGGYVKIYGQEEAINSPNSFSSKPVWKRMTIIISGVLMNFIASSIIFYIVLARTNFNYTFDYSILDINKAPMFGNKTIQTQVYSSKVLENSPAKEANMPDIFIIKSINDIQINNFEELGNVLNDHSNEEVKFVIEDINAELKEYKVNVNSEGKIGIEIGLIQYIQVSYNGFNKLHSGFLHSVNILQYQLRMLTQIISISLINKESEILKDTVSGPVGVYQVVNYISQQEDMIYELLNMTALFGINIAFINILPIPVFDGGYVMFLLYELITKKKVPKKAEKILLFLGLLFIIILSITSLWNDISQYKIRLERLK